MAFTPEQKKKIDAWMAGKGAAAATCSACRSKRIGICARPVLLTVESDVTPKGAATGSDWRYLTVHCEDCGEARLFKASVIGI